MAKAMVELVEAWESEVPPDVHRGSRPPLPTDTGLPAGVVAHLANKRALCLRTTAETHLYTARTVDPTSNRMPLTQSSLGRPDEGKRAVRVELAPSTTTCIAAGFAAPPTEPGKPEFLPLSMEQCTVYLEKLAASAKTDIATWVDVTPAR